eukprot:123968-Alexandrium_andersonii.AAC.1
MEALWVTALARDQIPANTYVARCWDPLLEAHPFRKTELPVEKTYFDRPSDETVAAAPAARTRGRPRPACAEPTLPPKPPPRGLSRVQERRIVAQFTQAENERRH